MKLIRITWVKKPFVYKENKMCLHKVKQLFQNRKEKKYRTKTGWIKKIVGSCKKRILCVVKLLRLNRFVYKVFFFFFNEPKDQSTLVQNQNLVSLSIKMISFSYIIDLLLIRNRKNQKGCFLLLSSFSEKTRCRVLKSFPMLHIVFIKSLIT